MMPLETEKDLEKTVELVLKHSSDSKAQRISLRAALRLYYSMGYRNGYNEAMVDAKAGRDKRVVAHLN